MSKPIFSATVSRYNEKKYLTEYVEYVPCTSRKAAYAHLKVLEKWWGPNYDYLVIKDYPANIKQAQRMMNSLPF